MGTNTSIFRYKMRFSPYDNSIKAKSYKDAWRKLRLAYPEYKPIKKVVQYLTRS